MSPNQQLDIASEPVEKTTQFRPVLTIDSSPRSNPLEALPMILEEEIRAVNALIIQRLDSKASLIGAVAGYFGGFTSLIGTILFIVSISRSLSLGMDLDDAFIKVAFIGSTGAVILGFGLTWIIQQAIHLGEFLSGNTEK